MTSAAQHILICFHDFSRGGTERIAIGLARHWVSTGRDVTILCGTTEGGLRATVDTRVRVVELDPPVRRSLTSRLRLGEAMASVMPRLAPDIIFLPGNFHLPLSIPLSKVRGNGAIISKISNPTVPKGILAGPVRWLVTRYRDCVDGVAAMNSGLEHDLSELLPGLNIATLYDPVYLNPEMSTEHVPADDGRLHILWAGRFEPQKDALLALKVIEALNRIVPARLTMLGDGAQHRSILRRIKLMGLTDIVAAPGYVPGIDPWLSRADALLVTSHFEGGPAVAVEALAHGVPVVSTDCSYFLRDIMTTTEAGRIVPSRYPPDLASALLTTIQEGARYAPSLHRLIDHLEPGICAQAYLDWFDKVLTQKRGKAEKPAVLEAAASA